MNAVHIVAVDPGNIDTAVVIYDKLHEEIVYHAKLPNEEVIDVLRKWRFGDVELVVEMIASYGLSVGRTVFDTAVWIGLFLAVWPDTGWRLIVRHDVKMALCHSARAKDANIRQAIIDRYGGDPKRCIGTKKAPGRLYGITADQWAALALALTAAENPDIHYDLGINPERKPRKKKDELGCGTASDSQS